MELNVPLTGLPTTSSCGILAKKNTIPSSTKVYITFFFFTFLIPSVAVHSATGRIVWCPWKLAVPGSVHDKRLMDLTGYEEGLAPGEWGMGDKGYIGAARLLCPFKGKWANLLPDQQQFNRELGQLRVLVERTIGRIKTFKCLVAKWHHHLDLHPFAFAVCAHLTNISLIDSPLFF